jgi:hypothetical protein
MKVVIKSNGGFIDVNTEETSVVIQLSEQDKANISNMGPGVDLYGSFPKDTSKDQIEKVMEEAKELL